MPNPPYKKDEYIHFIYEKTGETKKVKAKNESERDKPKHNLIEIPFSHIEAMNLNNRGEVVPYSAKNVINFSRYMAWYWCPIIGADACMLYMHLTEYCDDTDICYPKLQELADKMKRSKPTITKLLAVLEENNFLVVIHRLNRLANNKETSPIYKLRQTIPLLSKEQYRMLPEKLQDKHDDFMDKYGKYANQELFAFDSSETWNELVGSGEKIISKSTRKKIRDIMYKEQDREYLLTNLEDNVKTDDFHNELMQLVSKPTFDMMYKDTMTVLESPLIAHVIVPSEDTRDYLKESETQLNKLITACRNLFGDSVADIEIYTTRDYIFKMERGR